MFPHYEWWNGVTWCHDRPHNGSAEWVRLPLKRAALHPPRISPPKKVSSSDNESKEKCITTVRWLYIQFWVVLLAAYIICFALRESFILFSLYSVWLRGSVTGDRSYSFSTTRWAVWAERYTTSPPSYVFLFWLPPGFPSLTLLMFWVEQPDVLLYGFHRWLAVELGSWTSNLIIIFNGYRDLEFWLKAREPISCDLLSRARSHVPGTTMRTMTSH